MEYKYKVMPTPPGETILELAHSKGMEFFELMEASDLTIEDLNKIIEGKAVITKEIAERLESALGVPAQFFLNLEKNFRESLYNLYDEIRTGN